MSATAYAPLVRKQDSHSIRSGHVICGRMADWVQFRRVRVEHELNALGVEKVRSRRALWSMWVSSSTCACMPNLHLFHLRSNLHGVTVL